MPRHVFRLVLLIVACAVIAYGAKRFFTVGSFYEYGHYRGNSVADIASDKPKFKGIGYCAPCHAQQVADWFKGVHNSMDLGKVVKCEVCHGAAGERENRGMFEASASGPDHPNRPQDGRSDRHAKALHPLPRTDDREAAAAASDRGRRARRDAAVRRLPQPAFSAAQCRRRRTRRAGERCGSRQDQGRRLRRLSRPRRRQQ